MLPFHTLGSRNAWAMNPFSYPVTRPIPVRYLPFLAILGLIVLAIATIFNLVAGGYEHIAVNSPDFNRTITLWYQRFVPLAVKSYTPEAWSCNASTIRFNDSKTPIGDQSDGSPCHKLKRIIPLQLSIPRCVVFEQRSRSH